MPSLLPRVPQRQRPHASTLRRRRSVYGVRHRTVLRLHVHHPFPPVPLRLRVPAVPEQARRPQQRRQSRRRAPHLHRRPQRRREHQEGAEEQTHHSNSSNSDSGRGRGREAWRERLDEGRERRAGGAAERELRGAGERSGAAAGPPAADVPVRAREPGDAVPADGWGGVSVGAAGAAGAGGGGRGAEHLRKEERQGGVHTRGVGGAAAAGEEEGGGD